MILSPYLFDFISLSILRLANAGEAYDKMAPLVNSLIETIAGSSGKVGVTPAQTNKTYNVGDTGPAGG